VPALKIAKAPLSKDNLCKAFSEEFPRTASHRDKMRFLNERGAFAIFNAGTSKYELFI
jgi:hypothetical protein